MSGGTLRESGNSQPGIKAKIFSGIGKLMLIYKKNPCFRVTTGIIGRIVITNTNTINKDKNDLI
jgi:hypothetical protein